MTELDVAVFGSLNQDLVTTSQRQPHAGETITGTGFELVAGGKGLNQAIAAARAGARTIMLGSVGDDTFGAELISLLKQNKIRTDGVRQITDCPTGTAQITVLSGGENTIIVAPGANGRQGPPDSLQEQAIESANCLLLQLEVPMESTLRAAQIASVAGTKVIFNPAPMQDLPSDLTSRVDVLVVNEVEAHALTGAKDLQAMIRKLGEMAPAAVLTLGSRGCLWVSGDTIGEQSAPRVSAVDTTGAGDTFVGYLGAQLSSGQALKDAVSVAVRAASLSVQATGASPSIPTMEAMLSAS